MKMNSMMMKLIFSIVIFIIPFLSAVAQTKNSQKPADTTKSVIHLSPIFRFQDELLTNDFRNEIGSLPRLTKYALDSSSIWMQTRLQLGSIINQDQFQNNFQTSILNTLRQQYAATQDLKLLKQILGTVQVGAVGYLAYLHLKKYGFLKRK